MPGSPDLPDWKDATAYASLLDAERAAFAWEWLRRNSGYRLAALQKLAGADRTSECWVSEQPAAARWGLHLFESPGVAVPHARPVWRRDRFPFVLRATAEPCADGPDAFWLQRHSKLATLVRGADVERLLLSDGCRSIRLDVRGASLRGGPVRLRYDVSGFRAARPSILTLERLCALSSSGRFSSVLHTADRRRVRNILLLRVHDALAGGADQRTIAGELLGSEANEHRWRIRSPSLRSRAQRLVRAARSMMQGEFWKLLL
jgi:hypothetical protein